MTINVAVTGAAGQIGYAMLFRLAAGALSNNQKISLRLLERSEVLPALSGVEMELRDCAFPLLDEITLTDDPDVAFQNADAIFLVGARPRGPGMERNDLLVANAEIFSGQGQSINRVAKSTTRILVVGNPANTNCLIVRHHAPNLPDSAFSAMTRLDHNRALAQLATQTKSSLDQIRKLIIWGNHSATQYPDLYHATISGRLALEVVSESWYQEKMIPAVQQRGAAIIKARGASSAASAASSAIDHVRDWMNAKTPVDDYLSMAILSQGEYGIEPGLIFSYPVRCNQGEFKIVDGLEFNHFSENKIKATEQELIEERDAVRHLLP